MKTIIQEEEKDIKRTNNVKDIKNVASGKEIKEILRGFIGREMVVTLRSKKALKGRLESVTNYELLITISHEPVLIMKHAIDFIELTETF